MSERDEFLAWVKTVGDGIFAGRYLDLMWKAWQARAARAPQAVPALTRQAVLDAAKEIGLVDHIFPCGEYFTFADHEDMSWRLVALVERFAAAPQPSPEPAHAHDWRFSLQDHLYKCDCGATRGDYPFGAASFKD